MSSLAPVLTDENWELLNDKEAEKAFVAEILHKIDEIALELTEKKLSEKRLTEKKVKEALHVASNVQKRKAKGGPAKKEVQRMIDRRKTDLEKDEKARQEKVEQVKRSRDELEREVKRKKRVIKVIRKPNPNAVVGRIKDMRK